MFLSLILVLTTGSYVFSLELTQPDSIIVQPGQSLTITCRVSGYSLTDGNYGTGWIRQREGKQMDWILSMWSDGSAAKNNAFKNKFSHSRDTSAGTATISGQNLQPEDTAVYYCVRQSITVFVRDGKSQLYYFDYWGRGSTVTVTGSTSPISTLFPLAQCNSGSGDQITLGCLAYDFSPGSLDFTWTDNSGNAVENPAKYISPLNNNKYTAVSVITVQRSKTPYRCLVNHSGNSKDVQVQPLKESPTTTVKIPDRTTVDGGSKPTVVIHIIPEQHIGSSEVTLVCLVSSSVQKNYNITWKEQEGTKQVPKPGTNFPAQQSDKKWLFLSVYTIATTTWKKNNTMFICHVELDGRSVAENEVSSVINNSFEVDWKILYDVNCTEGMCHEVECSSLWSTTYAFIFLFIFSLLYNMILSLVKVKRS